MNYSFYQLMSMFLTYSFLGWCVEVIYAACELGKFVNRGFLNGAVCPIYGFGAIIIVLLLNPLKDNVPLLFLFSVLLTSVLEFFTGWALEKFFNQKWWDYTNLPFNIGGYVCLKFSLVWGLACVLAIKLLHPAIMWSINHIPRSLGVVLLCILCAMFAADLIVTLITILRLPKKLVAINELENALHSISDKIGEEISDGALFAKEKSDVLRETLSDKREETEKAIYEKYRSILGNNGVLHNRLFKAFPNLKDGKYKIPVEKLTEYYEHIKNFKK